MEPLADVRFNPKQGFIQRVMVNITDANKHELCKAMLKTDDQRIASYELTDITLGDLKENIKKGGDANIILYNKNTYTPFYTEVDDVKQIALIMDAPASEDVIDEYLTQLALVDGCLHRGNVDLSSGGFIENLEVKDRWTIKLIARRSGAASDIGEYKFFPTCRETSESVWKGKMQTLQNKGLTADHAKNYIRAGLKLPYPYAEDVMSFVIHQVTEYGELWIWHRPQNMKEMDNILNGQVSAATIVNPARKWVAYNMLLGTLGLDQFDKHAT